MGVVGVEVVAKLMGIPPTVSIPGIIIAFCFAALTGIFFGFYPAYMASKLEPIQALRTE
ncbi:MAG: hypothetical protein K6T17_03725 [Fimbriimonadales bacterium]|nr:hypothetical protein [Fimbriimonadales bacterium]